MTYWGLNYVPFVTQYLISHPGLIFLPLGPGEIDIGGLFLPGEADLVLLGQPAKRLLEHPKPALPYFYLGAE